MIIDPVARTAISSLGWVDGGRIWCYDVSNGERTVPLSDARYIELRQGTGGYFAVIHHYQGERLKISVHSFEAPELELASCVIAGASHTFLGDVEVWRQVPRYYVGYLQQPTWATAGLIDVDPSNGVTLQTFDWFDDSYDKGYQGIIGVVPVPDSHLVIISVQRDSRPVIYDPARRTKVGEIPLGDNRGNPSLYFSRNGRDLWADDYDTMVRIDRSTWGVITSRRVQSAAPGAREFIGQYAFDSTESLCLVARPFSGDVVGLDPSTLLTRSSARLGMQPLEVAALADRSIVARDWQSGVLLRGTLLSTS